MTQLAQLDGKTAVDVDQLLEFLFRMGQAYLASGEQTPQVELTLRRIATAYGMRRHWDVEASLVGRDPGLHEPRHATERPEADLRHAAGPEFAFEFNR